MIPDAREEEEEEEEEAREDGGGRSWRVEELEAAEQLLKLSGEPKVAVCTRGGGRSWLVTELELEAAEALLKVSEEPKVDVCTQTVSRDHVDIATGSDQKDSGRRIPRSSGRRLAPKVRSPARRKTKYSTLESIYADPRSYLDSSG